LAGFIVRVKDVQSGLKRRKWWKVQVGLC
jgi:hypothetical protein